MVLTQIGEYNVNNCFVGGQVELTDAFIKHDETLDIWAKGRIASLRCETTGKL